MTIDASAVVAIRAAVTGAAPQEAEAARKKKTRGRILLSLNM